MQNISNVLSVYKNFLTADFKKNKFEKTPDSLADFVKRFYSNLWDNKSYFYDINGSKFKDIHPDRYRDAGYTMDFKSQFEKGFSISIRAGMGEIYDKELNMTKGTSSPNVLKIEFPDNYINKTLFATLENILKETIKYWDPDVGFIKIKDFEDAIFNPENWKNIGWSFYCKNKNVINLIKDEEVEKKENFYNGTLIKLTDEVPSGNNSMLIKKTVEIRDRIGDPLDVDTYYKE